MHKINVLVAGSTGYIGIELVKILINHKYVNIKYLCGNTSAGKSLSNYDKDLRNKHLPKIIKFNKNLLSNVDVIFTALPNGEAQKISNLLLPKNYLIDLSADFRLRKAKDYLKWYKINHNAKKNIKKSIYLLPELNTKKINTFKIISCPGCYPTSILLPLIPIVKKNLINLKNIIIDSKSGYSGAGRGVHKKYAKKNLYESISAYGLGVHRHNSEIQQEFNLVTKKKVSFSFTPHLSPMFRGILSTIYLDLPPKKNIKSIHRELIKFYKKASFVKVLKFNKSLSTNDVINTNKCHISVCRSKNKKKIIILSTLDNLIKGGSGQAVQNLNLLYGFNEKTGLH